MKRFSRTPAIVSSAPLVAFRSAKAACGVGGRVDTDGLPAIHAAFAERKATYFLTALWLVLVLCSATSAEPEPSLRFRRVYVPADRIEDYPRGSRRYLPMDADVFERLLSSARPDAASQGPSVASARYMARLESPRLLRGQGTLEITPGREGPALLRLEPCSAAVESLRWIDSDDGPASDESEPSDPADEPAESSSPGVDVQGRLAVLVAQSGELALRWSVRGRDDDGSEIFAFDLPTSPRATLALDLPGDVVPELEQGMLLSRSDAKENRRTWEFALAAGRRIVLRLDRSDANGALSRSPRATETTVYDFKARGIEVQTRLTLDAVRPASRQLVVALDRPLALASAHCGETPIRWQPLPAKASTTSKTSDRSAASNVSRVVLELPEANGGRRQTVRLVAVGPLATDQPWTLPRIRAEGVSWEEGEATLWIPDFLRLERLDGFRCRQSGMSKSATPRSGESVGLQLFAPEATATVLLTRPRSPLRVESRVDVTLDDGGATAVLVAALTTPNQERFDLEILPGVDWIVDSVKSLPDEQTADWALLPRESDAPRRLVVRLSKPLAPGREPLRLAIRARRLQSPLDRPFRFEDLTPVEFADAESGRRIVVLRAEPPYELVAQGAKPRPMKLDAADAQAFKPLAVPPGGWVMSRDDQPEGLRFAVRRRGPTFSAAVRIDVATSGAACAETYRFRCVPDASRLDRVLVHFAAKGPPDANLAWSIAGESGSPAVRRLTESEKTALGLGAEGETWEVVPRTSQAEPFEIVATRSVAFHAERSVCLAALPQAAEQTGVVAVRSTGATPPRIRNHRLSPVPAEPASPGRRQTVRAAFRFDPARDVLAATEPSVSVAPGEADPRLPQAVAWSCRLDSRFEPGGHSWHRAEFRIENQGKPELTVRLPDGVRPDDVREVRVDYRPAAWQANDDSDRTSLRINLPRESAFVVVSIRFRQAGPSLGLFHHVPRPLPEADVPLLAGRWNVWLPPGREPVGGVLATPTPCLADPTWTERLFGPLGRGWHGNETADSSDDASARAPSQSSSASPSVNPWATLPAGHEIALETPGWTVCRLDLLSSPGLDVAHRPPLDLTRWLALLATVGLVRWSLRRRPATLALLAGAAAAAALIGPIWLVPAASGVFLGILLCGLCRIAWSGATKRRENDSTAAARAHLSTVAFRGPAALLTFAMLLPSIASAQSPTAGSLLKKTSSTTPVEATVLIPTDKNRKPTGGRVYVSERLFDALHGRAALGGGEAGGLLTEIVHRGELAWQGAPKHLTIEGLAVEITLRTFAPGARVILPLPRESLAKNARFLLDGRPVSVEWTEETDSRPSVAVAQPGPHRLEVPLRPTLWLGSTRRGASWVGGFDVSIVPTASSRLELTLPPDAPAVDVPSARGSVTLDNQRLVAELGPADQISVRWSDRPLGPRESESPGHGDTPKANGMHSPNDVPPANDVPEPNEMEVEQLAWLRVAPGSVVVEVQFHCRAPRGQVGELAFDVDPRLQLLDTSPGASLTELPDRPHSRLARWTAGPTDRASFRARYLLKGASGVGSLWLPDLTVRSARVTRRWLAVSVDSSLDGRVTPRGALPSIDAAEFHDAWSEGSPSPPPFALEDPLESEQDIAAALAMPPDAAFDLAKKSVSPWRLRLTPKPSRTLVDQTVALRFGAKEVAVRLDAELHTTAGYGFAYRLALPERLRVQTVRVVEDGRDRVVRWSQSGKAVDVFLDGPVSGARRLSLEGVLPVPPMTKNPSTGEPLPGDGRPSSQNQNPSARVVSSEMELSLPRLEGSEWQSSRVDVYRRPSVQVEVVRHSGLIETGAPLGKASAPAADSPTNDDGRLAASFLGKSDQPAKLTVRLRPNRPRVTAQQTTTMRADGETWRAEIDVSLSVRRGVLDEIALRVPSEWTGPLTVSPATVSPATVSPATVSPDMPSQFTQTPDDGGRLVLRPKKAVAGGIHFRVSGPVAGPRVVVPEVVLEGVETTRRLVRLPRRVDGEPTRWETRQLRRVAQTDRTEREPDGESENASPSGEDAASWTTHEVVGDRFQAALAPSSANDGKVRVELADVRLAWQADGTCRGAAVYCVDPAGRSTCPLELPQGFKLVRLTVAGEPSSPLTGSNSRGGPAGPNGQTSAGDSSAMRVRLASRTLPQPIEIVFTGRVATAADGSREFAIPRLGDAPVRRTLWTVAGPAELRLDPPLPIGPTEHAMARARAAESLLGLVLKGSNDNLDELRAWSYVWQDRWNAMIAGLEECSRADAASPSAAEARQLAARLRRDGELLDARLNRPSTAGADATSDVNTPVNVKTTTGAPNVTPNATPNVTPNASDPSHASAAPVEPWRTDPSEELSGEATATVLAVTFDAGRLSLSFAPARPSTLPARLAAAALLLLLAAAARLVVLRRARPPAAEADSSVVRIE